MTDAPHAAPSVPLDIYGYRVEVRSFCASALNGIAEDFAFFRSHGGSGSRIVELVEQAPPYEQLPPLTANVYTPRNVSYRDGNRTYVDYSGRALGVHHRDTGSFTIYSENADLLYEGAYLFLLSQCGEAFDARRLHRVHALGVCIRGRAALALLPMGGGKSTLGWQLLNYPDVELLSDDSPLIDAGGTVHAFPLRLGLLPGSDLVIPERQLRRINRMEFGPKLLVNYSYFADRVRPAAEPCLLFLGKRSSSRSCSMEPAGSAAALRALLSNCIVGMGLFQGMEFVFQRSAKEIAFKAVIASRRLRASLNLIRRSKTFHLLLGRDPVENGRVVHDFLDRHAGG